MKVAGLGAGAIGAALVALGCVGCGGGDGVSCEFADCGGDPTGNWSVEGVCGDFSALTQELENNCAGLEVSYDFSATGSVSFNANNTYDSEIEVRVDITASFPAACIAGTFSSCTEISEGFDGDAVCSGNVSDRCDCEFSEIESSTDGGAWQVNGDVLLLGDDPAQANFCQDGDTLRLETIADEPDDPTVIYVLSRN